MHLRTTGQGDWRVHIDMGTFSKKRSTQSCMHDSYMKQEELLPCLVLKPPRQPSRNLHLIFHTFTIQWHYWRRRKKPATTTKQKTPENEETPLESDESSQKQLQSEFESAVLDTGMQNTISPKFKKSKGSHLVSAGWLDSWWKDTNNLSILAPKEAGQQG